MIHDVRKPNFSPSKFVKKMENECRAMVSVNQHSVTLQRKKEKKGKKLFIML